MKNFSECPIEDLHKSLDYNPETGSFTRKIDDGVRGSMISRWSGKPTALNKHGNGYLRVGVGIKQYLAHRVAWAIHYGQWPSGQIDHINRVRDDNRICNLRVVSPAENMMNLPIGINNKSGVVGVFWRKERKKWRATVQVNRKQIFLGYFDDLASAQLARETALKKYRFHPNHGRL